MSNAALAIDVIDLNGQRSISLLSLDNHLATLGRTQGSLSMREMPSVLNLPSWQAYSEVLIQSGGYPIVLSLWDADPRKAKRGTLVFCPGTGDHPLLYSAFLEGFVRAGYHVVGIHFAGTGKSPRRDLGYRWDTFKENVRDAIRFARGRYHGPIGLMGSSQGGILTLQMAAELEKEGLIDLAICHNLAIPAEPDAVQLTRLPPIIKHLRWLAEPLIRLTSAIFPNWAMPLGVYLNEDGIFDSSEISRMNREDPIKNRYLPYRFFFTFIRSRPAKPIETLKTPILVIAGDKDPIFPLPYIKSTYDRLGSPDKELMVFPNHGHLFMVESPEIAVRSILPWLNDRRPIGATT